MTFVGFYNILFNYRHLFYIQLPFKFSDKKRLDSVERQEIYGCQKIAGSKYYELIDLGNDVCHFRDKCGHMFVRNPSQCYSLEVVKKK